jgi:hypothetical protein
MNLELNNLSTHIHFSHKVVNTNDAFLIRKERRKALGSNLEKNCTLTCFNVSLNNCHTNRIESHKASIAQSMH